MKKYIASVILAAILISCFAIRKESKYVFLYKDEYGKHFMNKETFDEVTFKK